MGRWTAAWLALPLALACNGGTIDDDDAFEAQVVLSEVVPTVATVSFEDAGGGTAEIVAESSEGQRIVRAVDGTDEGPVSATLVGLKAGTDYSVHVEITGGSRDGVSSAPVEITTGNVPTVLPSTDVLLSGDAVVADGYLVTSVFAPVTAAVILDGDGDYVWWSLPDAGEDKVSRVVPSVDGESLLFWYVNIQDGPGGPLGMGNQLTRWSFTGEELAMEPIERGHHDFAELPDGTIAFLDYDTRETVDGEKIGDRLMELAPDGTLTQIWSVWDSFVYDPDSPHLSGVGWSHANALDYVAAEDAYYISLFGLNCIVNLDRASGEIEWILGGANGDFLHDGMGPFFIQQHQFQRLDDSLIVFDNGDPLMSASRAVEYQLDTGEGVASMIWSYAPSPDIYSFSLGDVTRLDNGNTLVTFSTSGLVHEVTPDGEVVWELAMGLGGALGYVTWVESL